MSVTLSTDASTQMQNDYITISSKLYYDKIFDQGFLKATIQKNEQIKKLERIHELKLSLNTQQELNLQELTILLSERADDNGTDEGCPDVCSICKKKFYKDKVTIDECHFHIKCKLEELTEQNKKLKKENKEIKNDCQQLVMGECEGFEGGHYGNLLKKNINRRIN